MKEYIFVFYYYFIKGAGIPPTELNNNVSL